MNKILLTALMGATIFSTSSAMADDHSHHDNGHHTNHYAISTSPTGVMGDHLHPKGEFMMSYTYMRMGMDGMIDDDSDLSDADILAITNPNAPPANYRIIPTEMTMDMHMLGAMYGISDSLTASIMVPYLDNEMDSTTYNMAGNTVVGTSSMDTSGFGDVQLTGLFSVYEQDNHTLNGRLGISLPTGSIDEESDMLMPNGMTMTMRAAYNMQLGTGTTDALPGLTYTYASNDWTYGAAYLGRLHMGRNDEGYTRGDWHQLRGWAGYAINETLGVTGILSGKTEDDIKGSDTNIIGATPLANPDYYGGETLNLGLQGSWKFYENNTVKANIEMPIYQKANGPQMEQDYAFSLRWQNSF